MNPMNKERVRLIVQNMELLVLSLKNELNEERDDTPNQQFPVDEYEPDYYEVED